MNENDFKYFLKINSSTNDKKGNIIPNTINDEGKELSFNENRINHKLTLRKQKIQEAIFIKREIKTLTNFFNFDINKKCEKEDILSGKFYDELETAYMNNDDLEIRNLINCFCNFLNYEKGNEFQILEILSKADSSQNIKNNVKSNTVFPLASLIFKIGINTNDKIIYIFSFILILDFTYKSNEFCKEITNEKNLNIIMERLIHFYPLFIENKQLNNDEQYKFIRINGELKLEEAESIYFGSHILKIFGNLFISTKSYKPFESINFYEKIFYLLFVFDLDPQHKKYLKFRYEYLDTLIWLIHLFIKNVENMIINFMDKILMIIPCLLKIIRGLYYTQETAFLESILELLEYLSDVNILFSQKLAESNCINILTNLFGYLFSTSNEGEIVLEIDNIDRILGIFINIFVVDSKYVQYLDFSSFGVVIEKLFDIFKVHHVNHFVIQEKLVTLLSNLACFEDIPQIVEKFMNNQKIINILYKYYYEYHKKETILFIDNVIVKQLEKIRDNILNLGGNEIIKKNICGDYNGSNKEEKEIIISSIKALYKITEKTNNIRKLFESLYNTPIPEKIKALIYVKDIEEEDEKIIIKFIKKLETYEKSLFNE